MNLLEILKSIKTIKVGEAEFSLNGCETICVFGDYISFDFTNGLNISAKTKDVIISNM